MKLYKSYSEFIAEQFRNDNIKNIDPDTKKYNKAIYLTDMIFSKVLVKYENENLAYYEYIVIPYFIIREIIDKDSYIEIVIDEDFEFIYPEFKKFQKDEIVEMYFDDETDKRILLDNYKRFIEC